MPENATRSRLNRRPKLLRQGNGKVGPDVWTWSLPAIVTCPGATHGPLGCVTPCYADEGSYKYPSVIQGLQARWELAAQRELFDSKLRYELASLDNGSVIRIHASGDFFSVEYAQAWLRLVKDFGHLQFYAYTRSWRVPEIRVVLNKLRKLRNCRIWASTDQETGPAPRGWHHASLGHDFDPSGIACPEQTKVKPDCSSCGLCWRVRQDRPVHLSFKEH